MVAVALLFAVMSPFFDLSRPVGFLFIALLVEYVIYSFRQEQVAPASDHGAAFDKGEAAIQVDAGLRPGEQASLGLSIAMSLGGLALVVVGGKLLVDGAVALARGYGIAESVIGLTIVAVGTSTPELVTSIVAAARRQSEIAFGNVVGSNIYNILGIGGATALIAPTSVPVEIVRFDNFVMLGVSALMFALAWTGFRIGRREGALLAGGYCVYVFVIWPS